MHKADYSWVILIVVVVVLIFAWKPLMGMFHNVSGKLGNADQIERGRLVFQDTEKWAGAGSYKSCAMCHDPAFQPDPTKEIKMDEYKPGEAIVLSNLTTKYKANILESSDELYEQAMRCLTGPSRMCCGRVSINADFVQDLLAYLREQ